MGLYPAAGPEGSSWCRSRSRAVRKHTKTTMHQFHLLSRLGLRRLTPRDGAASYSSICRECPASAIISASRPASSIGGGPHVPRRYPSAHWHQAGVAHGGSECDPRNTITAASVPCDRPRDPARGDAPCHGRTATRRPRRTREGAGDDGHIRPHDRLQFGPRNVPAEELASDEARPRGSRGGADRGRAPFHLEGLGLHAAP